MTAGHDGYRGSGSQHRGAPLKRDDETECPDTGPEHFTVASHKLIIVAVEEAAFLMAVQRVVRGVEVEDDLPGARSCASSNRSTNRASIAAGSWLIFL